MFAFAAMLRILVIATQLNQDAGLHADAGLAPRCCWGAAALLLAILRGTNRGSRPATT